MKNLRPVMLLSLPVLFLVSCERTPRDVVMKDAVRKAELPEELVHLPQFEEVHRNAVLSFESTEGMGKTRFQWSRHPADGEVLADQNGMKWRVEMLELVSILEHNPPKAYTREFHSTHGGTETYKERKKYYDERKLDSEGQFNVRNLTKFETEALSAIRKDATLLAGDASAGDGDGHLRFMGAVRAQQECLKCHEGKVVGDVLGAFTWRLSPVGPGDGKVARR